MARKRRERWRRRREIRTRRVGKRARRKVVCRRRGWREWEMLWRASGREESIGGAEEEEREPPMGVGRGGGG